MQGPGVDLRRSLDRVHATAQEHLAAIQDAYAALDAFEQTMANERDVLGGMREDLNRERAALDQERNAHWLDRAQQELHHDPEPALAGHPEMMMEEGEAPPQDEPQDYDNSSLPTAGGGDQGGWLFPKGPKTALPGPGGILHNGAGGGRRRSRSRSRSPSRRRGGGGGGSSDPAAEALRATISRLGLDENASRQIQQFPPEEALPMLEQVGDGVRNPSAFVMKMVQRARSTGPDMTPSDSDRIEAAIRDIGLDDSAARVLRSNPVEEALYMIDQINKDTRNPSAFIMSLSSRTGGRGKGGSKGPALEDSIRNRSHSLNLDQSSTRMLAELPPDQAWGILEQIRDDVRNPSAFVTAEVRKITSGGGKGRHDGGGGGGGGGGPKRGGGELNFSRKIEEFARQLDLDGKVIDALQDLHPEDAVQILDRLAADITTIRNRSAFVFAEVKKRRAAPPPATSARRSSSSGVPCKFFAEGRCKNGADCRFSHA